MMACTDEEQGIPYGSSWLLFSDLRLGAAYLIITNYVDEYNRALSATPEELRDWTLAARNHNEEMVSADMVEAAWNLDIDAVQKEAYLRNLVCVVGHPRHLRCSDFINRSCISCISRIRPHCAYCLYFQEVCSKCMSFGIVSPIINYTLFDLKHAK